MPRYAKLLFVLLLIGVAQSRVTKRDTLDDANDAIDFVESKAKEFQLMINNVELEIEKLIQKLNEQSTPALDDFLATLTKNINYLEENIKSVTNIDLTLGPCGPFNLHKDVQSAYKKAQQCSSNIMNEILLEVSKSLGDIIKLAEEFKVIRNKIKQCKQSNGNDIEKTKCIEEAKKTANEIIEKFNKYVSSIDFSSYLIKFPEKLTVCISKESMQDLMNNFSKFMSCLVEHSTNISITDAIREIKKIFEESVAKIVNRLVDAIINEFKKIENILNKILGKFREQVADFVNVMKEVGKTIFNILEIAAKEAIRVVCHYCPCFLCKFCPECKSNLV